MIKLEKAIREASELLLEYLGEFPEHDQGDYRVWEARQILEQAILTRKSKQKTELNDDELSDFAC